MTPMSSEPQFVVFRGGFMADWEVVSRLLDLESRGAKFVLLDGGRFKVVPPGLLTDEDRVFLKSRRDEARSVIAYDAATTPE